MPLPVDAQPWVCPQCGRTVLLKPFQIKGRKTCGRACAYSSLRVAEPVRKTQGQRTTFGGATCRCGAHFVKGSPGSKYCSHRCALDAIHERAIDRSVEPRPCEMCGWMFRPRPNGRGRFCSVECRVEGQKGAKSALHKGGRIRNSGGYISVLIEGTGKYELEHRRVMAEHLGRPLSKKETVHHINGIRDDNRIENLELWASHHGAGQRVHDPHCPTCTCGQ